MPDRTNELTWTEFAQIFGERLAQARVARGLSQERVAHMAGISSYTYQKYEKGESKPGTPLNPQATTIVALSQALGISVGELFEPPLPDMTSGR